MIVEMIANRDELKAKAKVIMDLAETENREFSDEEKIELDSIQNNVKEIQSKIDIESAQLEIENKSKQIQIVGDTKKMDSKIYDWLKGKPNQPLNIALGDNGESTFASRIFSEAGANASLLNLITTETAVGSEVIVPVFSPSINNVGRVSEDGTGSNVSTAAFAPVKLATKAYLGYAPVTDMLLKYGPTGTEDKLAKLFAQAFANQMVKEIVIGNGTTEFEGAYTNSSIVEVDCAVAGVPKLKDLLKVTSKLSGKFLRSQLSIIINPEFWANIMAEDTKWSYINTVADYFTFNGVKIIESDYAPVTTTAGSPVALVGYLGDYGLARSEDMTLELLPKVAGSLNNNLQATMYMEAGVIVPSSFAKLVTV